MMRIPGLPPDPPSDTRLKVFWFIKVCASFYGEWFNEHDVMERVSMPRTTVIDWLKVFAHKDVDVLESNVFTMPASYRVKRRGE